MLEYNIENITSDDYEAVKFLLNSELRMKILQILIKKDASKENIISNLNKQETNVLRTLKELQDKNLISHNHDVYSITSSGYLACRNISNVLNNWKTIDILEQELDKHIMDNMPLIFARYMYVWEDAEIIHSDYVDYNKTIEYFGELISKSKNFRMILPMYSQYHLDIVLNAVIENNTTLDLITSKTILKKIEESNKGELFNKLKDEGSITLTLSKINIYRCFFVLSDDFALFSLFLQDNSFDDSFMVVDENKEDLKIHYTLFNMFELDLKEQ